MREFGSTLLRELDYTIEAYNTRRLERVLAKIDGVHVPAVEPALSSGRVLTLEFIDGVKSTDTPDIDAAGLDRQELARNFVRGAVQMVMIDGFFHADPHPGNVVVELASGRLTFLDAGMVGQLDLRKRIRFARFLLAFRDKDVSELARTLRSLSEPFREPDESAFQREFERRIGPLIDQPAGRTAPLQKLVSEAVDVLRDAGYRLDPQLTLAAKAVAQAEAITSALVPEAGASDFAQLGRSSARGARSRGGQQGRHPRRGAQAGNPRRRRGGRAPALDGGSRRLGGSTSWPEARSPSASASPTSTATRGASSPSRG